MSLLSARDCTAILLSAGRSTRFGSPKGLAWHRDQYWLERQLNQIAASEILNAVIVLGSNLEDYFYRMPVLEQALRSEVRWKKTPLKISVVINENLGLGPFYSIQMGIKKSEASSGFFVSPIDVPWISKRSVDELLSEALPSVSALIPTWQGKGGHPVWLSESFAKNVVLKVSAKSDPEARLDLQLKKLGQVCKRVAVGDARVTLEWNTVSEFEAARAFFESEYRL